MMSVVLPRNKHIWSLSFIALMIALPNYAKFNQQPTPTPETETSVLVSANSCFPPCWLGLIPGKSTVENALGLLKTMESYPITSDGDELDPQTGYVANGAYSLWWEHLDTTTDDALIGIRESKVDQIVIRFNHTETLEQIVNSLGYPDFGYLDTGSSQLLVLDLIYLNLYSKISLHYPFNELCTLPNVKQKFRVDEARFYSEKTLAEAIEYIQDDAREHSRSRYYVPIETLQTWLDDPDDLPCTESWNRLTSEIPPLILTPSSATLTPEPD
jgi:hypothetical protein